MYCDEEQRSRAGWIVAPISTVIFERVLSARAVIAGHRDPPGLPEVGADEPECP
jgi:hypothetical protein